MCCFFLHRSYLCDTQANVFYVVSLVYVACYLHQKSYGSRLIFRHFLKDCERFVSVLRDSGKGECAVSCQNKNTIIIVCLHKYIEI